MRAPAPRPVEAALKPDPATGSGRNRTALPGTHLTGWLRTNPVFAWFLAGTFAYFLLQVQLFGNLGIFCRRHFAIDGHRNRPFFHSERHHRRSVSAPGWTVPNRTDWPKKALIIGALGYACGYGFVAGTQTMTQIIGCVAIVTFSELFVSPAQQATVTALAPPDKMGRYAGLFGTAQTLGQSIGPLLGGTLLAVLPGRLVWPVLAAFGLLAAVSYGKLRFQLPKNET